MRYRMLTSGCARAYSRHAVDLPAPATARTVATTPLSSGSSMIERSSLCFTSWQEVSRCCGEWEVSSDVLRVEAAGSVRGTTFANAAAEA
eukprot:6979412-Prymnesium_polylepis.1